MDHRFKFLVWVFLVSQININNRSENLGFFFFRNNGFHLVFLITPQKKPNDIKKIFLH